MLFPRTFYDFFYICHICYFLLSSIHEFIAKQNVGDSNQGARPTQTIAITISHI